MGINQRCTYARISIYIYFLHPSQKLHKNGAFLRLQLLIFIYRMFFFAPKMKSKENKKVNFKSIMNSIVINHKI